MQLSLLKNVMVLLLSAHGGSMDLIAFRSSSPNSCISQFSEALDSLEVEDRIKVRGDIWDCWVELD